MKYLILMRRKGETGSRGWKTVPGITFDTEDAANSEATTMAVGDSRFDFTVVGPVPE
jgi:hypothetical protein